MSRRHAPEPDAPEQPLPVLVLTDGIVFPFITAPLTVTGERQQAAADAALAEERLLFLVAPRRSAESDPEPRQLWRCLLYTSPSPRDRTRSRMPSFA